MTVKNLKKEFDILTLGITVYGFPGSCPGILKLQITKPLLFHKIVLFKNIYIYSVNLTNTTVL